MTYDHIIIGGGIAGLYFSYKMIQRYPDLKILLLESTSRLGGRIHTKTIRINDEIVSYDAGAGRFFESHTLVVKLIKELELNDKIKTIPNSDIHYISKNDEARLNLGEYIQALQEKIKINSYADLVNKNLYEVMVEYLGEAKANRFREMYIYWDDLMDCNSIDGMRFLNEMNQKEFYVLHGGMSQIIDVIVDKIKDKITIITNADVIYFNAPTLDNKSISVGTYHGEIYESKNLVFACPKNAIKKINGNKISPSQQFKLLNMLDMVESIPLARVFCTYPLNPKTNLAWFDGLHKFTTSPPIKFTIPMNSKHGFIQISYVNSINARIIKAIHARGDLKSYLESYFRDLFVDKEIPNIDQLMIEYCDVGVHHWVKGFLGYKYYKDMIQPFTDLPIYIIGESYSLNQAWCEGALETADYLVNKLS